MNKDLPDGWKWVKLGDIAFEVSDRIDKPSKSGLERFVGLEHFDSESLTVKRWGSTDDVTSAMKLFKKGDMLFARRNAYLKRASMATFDGVCSGDAIVLRQKNEKYVNGLLPLILNTEKLWEFAIANASGSMSKRVKWRDLATFEIPLPPKEEQRSIADILWAAEDCIVKNEKLVDEAELYKEILMKKMLTKGLGHKSFKNSEMGRIPENWIVKRIGDICKVVTGGTPSTSHSEYFGGTINWLKSGDIKKTYIYNTEEKITQLGIENSNAKIHPVGGIAIALSGQGFTRGKTAILKEPMACSQSVAIMIPNSEIVSEFLHYNLSNRYMEIRNLTGHQNRTGLNLSIINNINITLPPLREQSCIAKILSKIDDTIEKAQENINKTKELKKMLINEFLNGGLETAVSISPQAKHIYETQVSE